MRRAVENVEVACGIPSLMQGRVLEDVARGIDELMIRQPVGVVAVIAPFNFPAMIPFWFLPYALACGNTVVMKPSEKTPLTMQRVAALIEEAGFPAGVVQVTHGGQAAVEALLDHPDVAAVSFVGSSPVARVVYARAAGNGKRVQCQGGGEEPGGGARGRRRRGRGVHRGRERLRVRGPAVSRGLAGDYRRRRPRAVPRTGQLGGRKPGSGFRARRGGGYGPGDPGREPGADRAADRGGGGR